MKKWLIFLCLFGASKNVSADTLVVSAAASMKDVLGVLAKSYRNQSQDTIRFNFASSGTLQRQIENGAPVDIFISAADKNMNELQAQGMVVASSRRILAQNRLVLIAPRHARDTVDSFLDLGKPQVRRVAIGTPQSVPAGRYAQQVLLHLGLWNAVVRKAVRCKDVREVLAQVEHGNVDAGIVYRTDAAISQRVRVVAVASPQQHSPIRYPLAIVTKSRHQTAARRFVTFLTSAQAKGILRRYQFQ